MVPILGTDGKLLARRLIGFGDDSVSRLELLLFLVQTTSQPSSYSSISPSVSISSGITNFSMFSVPILVVVRRIDYNFDHCFCGG